MTDAEKKLWHHLRNRQFYNLKFRRQVPCAGYVADFLCHEAGLIVEVDGGQHSDERDAERTKRLEEAGFMVIRFWNNDVLTNIEGVMTVLEQTVETAPHPGPLPKGEGEQD